LAWVAALALVALGAVTPAIAASTIVTGQHLHSQVEFPEPAPTPELVWTHDIGGVATAPRVATSVPATRIYMAGSFGQVADPQGTRVYVNVLRRDDGVFGYSTLAVDSVSGNVVDSVDLPQADLSQFPRASNLVLDAAHGRLLTFSATDSTTTVLELAAVPLAVTGSWPFPCESQQRAAMWAISSDGARVYASCGTRILILNTSDGAIVTTATMDGDVESLLLDAQTGTILATAAQSGQAPASSVLVYDDATLALRATYAVAPDPYLLAINQRSEVLFVANIDRLFSLDVESAQVVDRGLSVVGYYVPVQGRSSQLIGVDLTPNCSRVDCFSYRVLRYDTSEYRVTDETSIDDRAADDPTRDSRYVGIDFIAVAPRVRRAVEYFHAVLGHYFVTADANEIAALDSGQFAGWARTGETFPVFISADDTDDVTTPVCRYYGRPEKGIDSHFYSASPAECAAVETLFGDSWILETSQAFFVYAADPVSGTCANATTPVYRLYNNRPDPNHRYTTSLDIRAQMIAEGWIAEGYGPQAIGFCVPRS